MFKEAIRRIARRRLFAPGCKLDLHQPKCEFFKDEDTGLYSVPYFSVATCSSQNALLDSPFYGFTSQGFWSNGYIAAKHIMRHGKENVRIVAEDLDSLFSLGEKVFCGSIVYFYLSQDTPVLVFCSQKKCLIFRISCFDAILSKLCAFGETVCLHFDIARTGLIMSILNEPVVYLSKIAFPPLQEGLIISHVEKCHALCGD